MAFRTLQQGTGSAISVDAKHKGIEGFLTAVRIIKKGGKRKKPSNIYTLSQQDGTQQEVWGSYAIDSTLVNGDGELHGNVTNHLIRLTYKGTKNIGGGKKLHEIEIAVDDKAKMKSKAVPF